MTTAIFNPVSILARGVKGAAAGKRSGILNHALLRGGDSAVSVSATDLEVYSEVSIAAPPCFACPPTIVSTATGEPVAGHTPADFPAVGSLDAEIVATIRSTFGELSRIADHLLPAIDSESSRYALGGVLLDCVGANSPAYIVATDGRRMHVARFASQATGTGPVAVIVSPRLFTGLIAAARAAARAAGRRAPAADDCVWIDVTATGARINWYARGEDGGTNANATTICRAIEGRFPNWRMVIDADPRGFDVSGTANGPRLAEWCREVSKATRAAARAAGDAAVAALPADVREGTGRHCVSKVRNAREGAEGRVLRGVTLDANGATARGVAMHDDGRVYPWTVTLDPVFLADAMDAAAAWNGYPAVTVHGTDGQSAVRIIGGDWEKLTGAGLLAVVMPLAND